MADDRPDGPAGPPDDDTPLAEVRDLRVAPDPDLAGRVQRDINRRTLAADSLDFSFNVMLATFWEHVRSLIDVWPGSDAGSGDDAPGA